MVKSGLEIVGTVFGVAALIISRLSDRRTRTGIVGAGTVNPGRWGSCHGVWSAVGASKTTAYVARSRCDSSQSARATSNTSILSCPPSRFAPVTVVLAVTPLVFAPIAAIKIVVAIYKVETSLGTVPIKLCSNGLPYDKLLEKALDISISPCAELDLKRELLRFFGMRGRNFRRSRTSAVPLIKGSWNSAAFWPLAYYQR